jgi:hypothetical protein
LLLSAARKGNKFLCDLCDLAPLREMLLPGCPGVYEPRTVVHTAKRHGEVMVIDHVHAEVSNLSGDVLFAPETVRRIEALLKATPPPAASSPSTNSPEPRRAVEVSMLKLES